MVDEKYQYIKQIGYGAYGVVCSALDKKTNKKVAIKKVAQIDLLLLIVGRFQMLSKI